MKTGSLNFLKKTALTVLSISGLFTLSLPAMAEVYKWVDDKGVTHYAAKPPQAASNGKVKNHQKLEIRDRLVGTTSPAAPPPVKASADTPQTTSSQEQTAATQQPASY